MNILKSKHPIRTVRRLAKLSKFELARRLGIGQAAMDRLDARGPRISFWKTFMPVVRACGLKLKFTFPFGKDLVLK